MSSLTMRLVVAIALVLSAQARAQDDDFDFFDEEPVAEEKADTKAKPENEKSKEASAPEAEEDPLAVIEEEGGEDQSKKSDATAESTPPPPEVVEEAPAEGEPTFVLPEADVLEEVTVDPAQPTNPDGEIMAPEPEIAAPEPEAVLPEVLDSGSEVAAPEDSGSEDSSGLPDTPAVAADAGVMGDDPDIEREKKFHRIYKKYNEVPTAPEVWSQVAGGATSEYNIQRGDTLWSISKTLFGDPEYWPKVWSLNVGEITNPHEIKPGMVLSFTAGTLAEPPELKVAAQGMALRDTVVIRESQPNLGANGKPARKTYKTPTPIPNSLPAYRSSYFLQKKEVDLELRKFEFPTVDKHLIYYVEDLPVVGHGRVVETEMGSVGSGEGQFIFVRLKMGETAKKFVVLKNLDNIKLGNLNNSPRAYLVEVQGMINILNLVNAKDNIYRAVVTSSHTPLEVGSLLVPSEAAPKVNVQENGTPGTGKFKVIGGQFEKQRNLLSDRSVVFVEGGRNSGLEVGQLFNVYANHRVRTENTKAIEGDRVIGVGKVVHVSDKYATVFVIKLSEAMYVGDYMQGEESAKNEL